MNPSKATRYNWNRTDALYNALDSMAVNNGMFVTSDRLWHAVKTYEALVNGNPNNADSLMLCLLRHHYSS
ncbi:hypothetical protein E6Q11_03015 [Candidatus Dojkabacteria bacterium]|uniref:Uncharacterized protein n=1 Tax=Candidatus Dojkabacteria bacterium TaxID=2099670 RepID=A0A5C7J762_9BACT|nr:MAG: hypothetical protein E6Q11_03015 [Candidatus Dojkabacteria bacterium]